MVPTLFMTIPTYLEIVGIPTRKTDSNTKGSITSKLNFLLAHNPIQGTSPISKYGANWNKQEPTS